MRHPWQRRYERRIDQVIDSALDKPSRENLDVLLASAGRQPGRLPERIRRRAAHRVQNAPEKSEAILESRDRLLQKIEPLISPRLN
ncbi:hypothetical protein [Thiohalomonas denitrificans]|uniref:Uncharacterized protein n=1 Tax=Thiohalomonas denitrificans TaxID=415747 RepID=A0A1G5PV32_9GAMM|nr:hypothetical protein [Thiohalomonas denitrificans]SCZ53096.1 hypothetical protein SAMN03097708_00866 [Thiohalomonas denitrificans]